MPTNPAPARSTVSRCTIVGVFSGVAACALLAACGGGGAKASRGAKITAEQFALTEAPAAPPASPPRAPAAAPEPPGDEDAFDVRVGAPQAAEGASPGTLTPAGEPVLIDAKIGDVNGKPIYAAEFLAPMADRLRAEAAKRGRDEWRAFTRQQVTRALDLFIADELLRAEALASLTPEQKQGFVGFLERLQRDYQRERGGSRVQADRRLAQTEGITLEEWRRRREDLELVRFQIADRIVRRVNVAYRDIEQRYDQLYERYNPPPTYVFRLAQVLKDDPNATAKFTELLQAGSFEEAARNPLNFNRPSEGGLEERQLRGAIEAAQFFGNPELNEAARRMKPGEVRGPIELSTSNAWLALEEVRVRAVPIYDAQLDVEDRVRSDRISREQDKYLSRLRSRASITDVATMVDQLVALAEERYYARPTPGDAR
ncbi:MAG TPA: peptidylprolyl isomerase [Phycisphaerales bacterium]|nr:peptidylprolyl isomerase [Phycisphaerales bacterium]